MIPQNRASMTGAVIQPTGMVEFEVALKTGIIQQNCWNCWYPYSGRITLESDKAITPVSTQVYSPKIKYSTPYYISPIEIALLWAKITYLKSHSKALAFDLQTDAK